MGGCLVAISGMCAGRGGASAGSAGGPDSSPGALRMARGGPLRRAQRRHRSANAARRGIHWRAICWLESWWRPEKRDSGLPPETTRFSKKSLTSTRRSTAESSTPLGTTVEGDADARRDTTSAWGTILVCPHALLDAPDLARIGMHAGPIPRPGNPASHGCIQLAATFRNSALSNGADWNAGPHHPLGR